MPKLNHLCCTAAVLALTLLTTGCGTGEHRVSGKLFVEPERRTTLTVEGSVRTVVVLEGRDGTLQLQVDDGDATIIDASSSYRKTFTGKLTVVLINAAPERASVNYRAKSDEPVEVVVTPEEEDE